MQKRAKAAAQQPQKRPILDKAKARPTPIKAANGFAVAVDGMIDVTSVYPTMRGAMVNWLVTHGVTVSQMWHDEQIRQVFVQVAARAEQKVEMVPIVMRRRPL